MRVMIIKFRPSGGTKYGPMTPPAQNQETFSKFFGLS